VLARVDDVGVNLHTIRVGCRLRHVLTETDHHLGILRRACFVSVLVLDEVQGHGCVLSSDVVISKARRTAIGNVLRVGAMVKLGGLLDEITSDEDHAENCRNDPADEKRALNLLWRLFDTKRLLERKLNSGGLLSHEGRAHSESNA
jgi:hypothetical protein